MGCFCALGIAVPLHSLMYWLLFPDFTQPVVWWSPLVKACHGVQRAGFTAGAFPEQGNGALFFLQYHFANLAVNSGLVALLEGRSQDAVMPDAGKSLGQDMEGEPSEELRGVQCTGFLFPLLPVVLYREADLSVLEAQDAVLADGNLVRVPTQVFYHLLGAEERPFAVDDPLFGKQFM